MVRVHLFRSVTADKVEDGQRAARVGDEPFLRNAVYKTVADDEELTCENARLDVLSRPEREHHSQIGAEKYCTKRYSLYILCMRAPTRPLFHSYYTTEARSLMPVFRACYR